jgi:N-methylhydantoinase A
MRENESAASAAEEIRIGIDIGGTFTDFVTYHGNSGRLDAFKLPSTPEGPDKSVLNGLSWILNNLDPSREYTLKIIHGSTVATNALLERKGAHTALLTTRGFRDVLQIGRQSRPSLYDLNADPPAALVPEQLRFDVSERVDSHGEVLESLDLRELDDILLQLKTTQVESIAICFLFSFLNDQHERECAEVLRRAGYFVSVSSEILPEYREYERTSTTAINAYVSPILSRYLKNLRQSISSLSLKPGVTVNKYYLSIMQSNGGVISLEDAQRSGARCILSGPAGGVVGAQMTARRDLQDDTDHHKLITFDMGGTSTDVSLIDDVPRITSDMHIGGSPIRLPVLDIHTIGAGGGSIASVDLGGALRVGPQSAGADPGPACYGRTDEDSALPTVTDANLLLGRISPEHFLGGEMRLEKSRSHTAISKLASKLGLTPVETALGIIEVVNAHMERALRVISIERGYDPRQFSLISFGGAGGLHAAELAERLGIRSILIPKMASTLSAYGMLAADVIKDYSQTIMLRGDVPYTSLESLFTPLIDRAVNEMESEGFRKSDLILEFVLDLRYAGQSYEISIPLKEEYQQEFHYQHQILYGYQRQDIPIEIVNLKLRGIGRTQSPSPAPLVHTADGSAEKAFVFERQVHFRKGSEVVPFYDGEVLLPEDKIVGPAVILCRDTTILVGKGFYVVVGLFGGYLMGNGYAN